MAELAADRLVYGKSDIPRHDAIHRFNEFDASPGRSTICHVSLGFRGYVRLVR